MGEELNSASAPLEHVESFTSRVAYRCRFEDLLLTFLDIAPRRDRTGQRDGRRRAMLAALDNRASYFQIRDWRQGHRPAPQWAYELVENKIAKRHAALDRHLKSKTAGYEPAAMLLAKLIR